MTDADYMQHALMEARLAAKRGEVPVGAVIVNNDGQIIARAGNAPIAICDPTAHAEILAIRAAAYDLGNYRLSDMTLYVTLEPCAMCAGAIAQARLKRLVYGAADNKGGGVDSGVRLFAQPSCHHHPEVLGGIMAAECGQILKDFFKAKRQNKAYKRQSAP